MAGESRFQRTLIRGLEEEYSGIFIIKGNSAMFTGIPDWLLLFNDRWAMLEVKASPTARKQPNQDYYVDMFNRMSFAAFIYPENAEEVLHDLHIHFS